MLGLKKIQHLPPTLTRLSVLLFARDGCHADVQSCSHSTDVSVPNLLYCLAFLSTLGCKEESAIVFNLEEAKWRQEKVQNQDVIAKGQAKV
jgi:hypothetical protein